MRSTRDFRPPGPPGKGDKYLRDVAQEATRTIRSAHRNSRRPLKTTITDFDEGHGVRHWFLSNSVKLYNEGNILRIETTVNDPSAFRGYRRKEGAPKGAAKKLLPIRKGVADNVLRAYVSQDVNDRFADHLATLRSDTPLRAILQNVTSRKRKRGRGVRIDSRTYENRRMISLRFFGDCKT